MASSALSLATRSARPPLSNCVMDSLRCLTIFSSTGEHLRIVEHDALVDFALLDGGEDQTDGAEPVFLTGAHRGSSCLR